MSRDAARLERLLDRYLEEALTSEEKTELEQMLRAESEARRTFWQHARLHALLRESGGENRGREIAAEPARSWWVGFAEVLQLVRLNAGWATAVAAVVVAVLGIWFVRVQTEATCDRLTTGVAVLAQAIDLEWAPGSDAHSAGATLSPGWLRIAAGLAQIEFSDGARVIVEGPAELQIVSRSEAFCRAGRLSAQVPPAARGFRISSPQVTVVDLGTAFGLEARATDSEVHVFEGKVELTTAGKTAKRELSAGEALGVDAGGAWRVVSGGSDLFPSADALERKARSAWERRESEWRTMMNALRTESSLLLLADFDAASPFERRLRNAGSAAPRSSDGAIVGARWAEGRWPGKRALEFKGVGDRVRIEIPGLHEAITLAAWVRVDSLDHNFNSLLLADSFSAGKIHWQITRSGRLRLGLGGSGDYDSPRLFAPERLGQWLHLAVIVDTVAGRIRHYVDGQEVAAFDMRKKGPLSFGPAEIGNWNPGARKDGTPIRNFNGRMDEMLVFRRALRASEIRGLSRHGLTPQLAFP